MCKFTYLGYGGCDEPERHYLIRREKCRAKAHIKHWCPPQDQEESAAADEKGKFWLSLPCPICADTPVVYDQPLLEIAHSRRSVLPAPHYDAVTGRYSRFAKHHVQYAEANRDHQQTPTTVLRGSPESLVPKPLKMARFQVERAASETAVNRIKDQELSPDYLLPATTYSPSPPQKGGAKMILFSESTPLTPPATRDSSRSPPQNRIDASVRAIPPGESSRHELESLRERAKAAAYMTNSRPATPQSRRGASDRSRSGSESSTGSSVAPPVLPPLPVPSRKTSNASSNASSSFTTLITASPSTKSTTSGETLSKAILQRPRRKDSATRSPPQDSVADSLAAAAMRPFERGRRPSRKDTGGSGSDRSNSPVVWRPTISQPTLQQDSLGIGAGSDIIVEPFKQRLVPFRPSKNGRSIARGQGLVENPEQRPRTRTNENDKAATTTNKTTALSLFPNPELDEKVATEAFAKMFETEKKAHAYQVQAQAQAMAQARAQADRAMGVVQPGTSVITSAVVSVPTSSSKHTLNNNKEAEDHTNKAEEGDYDRKAMSNKTGGAARKADKMLPNVPIPTALRRIKTGQVKTVTVLAPTDKASSNVRWPIKRANTADVVMTTSSSNKSKIQPPQISAPTNFVKVKTGAPLFSFAGVNGSGSQKYAQEFEIVTGPDGGLLAEPTLGEAF